MRSHARPNPPKPASLGSTSVANRALLSGLAPDLTPLGHAAPGLWPVTAPCCPTKEIIMKAQQSKAPTAVPANAPAAPANKREYKKAQKASTKTGEPSGKLGKVVAMLKR